MALLVVLKQYIRQQRMGQGRETGRALFTKGCIVPGLPPQASMSPGRTPRVHGEGTQGLVHSTPNGAGERLSCSVPVALIQMERVAQRSVKVTFKEGWFIELVVTAFQYLWVPTGNPWFHRV